MNNQIETWRVKAFASDVYTLSQQEASVIAPFCKQEVFVGKSKLFDRLGQATAIDKTGRNTPTPNLDIEHSRRMVTTVTRHWGTVVDNKDKVQQIHDPASEYSKAAQMAMGRKIDQVMIAAAFGTAYGGEDGTSTTYLGNAQKVTAVASSALAYPTVQMLRKASRIMNHNNVKGKRVIFYAADFLDAMLEKTEVTSSDYNTVKALVNGEINTYMGFEFRHCEELDSVLAATYDTSSYAFNVTTGLYDVGGTALGGTEKCALAMVEGSVIMGKNPNELSRVSERDDLCYSAQIYAAMDFGGVRMEEAKVVQLIYKA